MRLIPPHLKIIHTPPIDLAPTLFFQQQLRKLARLPVQLRLQGIYVIGINVGIAHGHDERAGGQVADFGEHVGEEGVGGDVEGDAEADVAGSLVELAGECTPWAWGRGRRELRELRGLSFVVVVIIIEILGWG